jgi:thymidylate kinase
VTDDEPLDVVARTADHQQNLSPPTRLGRAAVVALPSVLGDVSARVYAHRAQAIRDLAVAGGGGDGPAHVVDLDEDDRSIGEVIDDLDARGVRDLVLWMSAPQAGFVRAFASRWPHGLSVRVSPEPVDPDHHDHATRRDAVLGNDPVLESRLRAPGVQPPRWKEPAVFVLAGLDRADVSAQCASLVASFEAAGLRARALNVHRSGAACALADELAGRTKTGAPLAAFRVARVAKLVDSLRALRDEVEPAALDNDALVFAQYTDAHLAAAAAQLGWSLDGHPALLPFPRPDARFLLALDPATALERVAAASSSPLPDEHPVALRGLARAFERQSKPLGYAVIGPGSSFDEGAGAVRARVEACLRERDAEDEDSFAPLPSVWMNTRAQSWEGRTRWDDERITLVIGGHAEQCELGADALDLREFARQRCGEGDQGFPEAFWIEAYAAQVALDLRRVKAEGGGLCRAAFWPAVLRRHPWCADLAVLDELERLALAEVGDDILIDTRGDAAEDAFRVLFPVGWRRWLRVYLDALGDFADERMWDVRE